MNYKCKFAFEATGMYFLIVHIGSLSSSVDRCAMTIFFRTLHYDWSHLEKKRIVERHYLEDVTHAFDWKDV